MKYIGFLYFFSRKSFLFANYDNKLINYSFVNNSEAFIHFSLPDTLEFGFSIWLPSGLDGLLQPDYN